MLQTTLLAFRSILAADPSVNPGERNRLVALLRHGAPAEAKAAPPVVSTSPRIMRRQEVAERLSVCLRTVDNLTKAGTLRKRTFPGRKRGCGFLAEEVERLMTGEGQDGRSAES